MNIQNIVETLNTLSQTRPIFHSEADFQHELAIALRDNGYACRLEVPFVMRVNGEDTNLELDILVIEEGDKKTAIELKYVKKRYEGTHGNEHFDLANSWGTNLSRFDCFADLQRVSALVDAGEATKGFAIFLTNQESAWENDVTQSENLGAQFSIHEGRQLVVGDVLNWTGKPYQGNVGTRRLPPYCPIRINQNINFNWRDYHNNENTCFRYLLLEYRKSDNNQNLWQLNDIQYLPSAPDLNTEFSDNREPGGCLQCTLGFVQK